MGDKRTDSGQYYPGGKIVSQHGVAPPQIIVQWSDIQGKPQIAPLPDRYRPLQPPDPDGYAASSFYCFSCFWILPQRQPVHPLYIPLRH